MIWTPWRLPFLQATFKPTNSEIHNFPHNLHSKSHTTVSRLKVDVASPRLLFCSLRPGAIPASSSSERAVDADASARRRRRRGNRAKRITHRPI